LAKLCEEKYSEKNKSGQKIQILRSNPLGKTNHQLKTLSLLLPRITLL